MTTPTEKPLQPAVPHVHIEPPSWMVLAQSYERMGILEVPGQGAHPMILKFHSHTTLHAKSDEVPWCSAFVCCCMDEAGERSTASAAARSWLNWGEKLEGPRIGCIVVSERKDPGNAAAAHVAFYAGNIDGTHYASLGGNQSNRVCTRSKPYAEVLGYRWPKGVAP